MNLPDSDPDFTKACSERTLQEESKGFFKTLVEMAINNTDIERWTCEKLEQNVYNADFVISFINNDNLVERLDELFVVKPMYRMKNFKKSTSARELAIKELEACNYKSALTLSNQAVILSPCDDSDSLTKTASPLILALWLRSECLMNMELFQLAMTDLQYGVKICDTTEKKGPFFYRQGECYKKMNEIQRAKISYSLALKCMKKNATFYKPAEKELANLEEKSEIKEPATLKKTTNCDNKDDILSGIKYLNVEKRNDMGRFVVAKNDLTVGEKILVEEPYAACLKFSSYGTNCYHCFERLQVSYGCQTCANLAFCSLKCRDEALGTYHKYECQFMDLFIGSGMSILCFVALRMITQNGLNKSLELYDKYYQNLKSNDSEKISKHVSLDNKEDLIYNLCTHTELRQSVDYLKRFLMAFFLLKCLKGTDFFGKDVENSKILKEDEVKILVLLFHNIQMLQFNAHEIEEAYYVENNKKFPIKSRAIGVGIYPTVSLFNHECYQGVMRYFQGKNIVIQTSRPIPSGAMIPENYGAVFSRQSRHERQRLLRSRYWFKCQCDACVEIWLTMEQLGTEKVPKLKCVQKSCNGKIDATIADCETICDVCKAEISIDYLQEKIERIKNCCEMYNNAEDLMGSLKFSEAKNLYIKALQQFHDVAYAPHYETHTAEHNLKTCVMGIYRFNDM